MQNFGGKEHFGLGERDQEMSLPGKTSRSGTGGSHPGQESWLLPRR